MSLNQLIKEGDVRFLQSGSWVDAKLKLISNSALDVVVKGKTPDRIMVGPGATVTRSKISNYSCVFVINTVEESSYTSGPMFSTTTDEETEEWIRMINLTRVRATINQKHRHPLTTYMPIGFTKVSIMPKSSYVTFDNRWICSLCQNKNDYPGVICEWCPEYKLCSMCEQGLKKVPETFRSPNHEHELMRFEKAEGEMWFSSAYNGSFNCDKCGQGSNGVVYHCLDCGIYDECQACVGEHMRVQRQSTNQNTPSEISLDASIFGDAFAVDGSKFTLKKNIPQQASMITKHHWDLSKIETEPVPHAYCEFTFHNFNVSSRVGVGIGNQIWGANQMLGYQQNSFGYFNNGMLAQNCDKFFENYLPAFKAGMTIGVGILYDSFKQRRLFFTKDGQMLEYFPAVIHKGMDVFPGVSFERGSQVSFTANFTGPFKFDPRTIPDYRADNFDRLSAVPAETLAYCLSFVSSAPVAILQTRLVSKKFADQALNNLVWKPLFLQRWRLQNDKLKLKSWYTLYKRRSAVDKHSNDLVIAPITVGSEVKLIENCDFEFLCPLKWDSLPGSGKNERHCDKCNKTVYRVDDEKTLHTYSQMGRCVSMFKLPKPGPQGPFGIGPAIPDMPFPPMMGVPPLPPRQVPPPFPGAKPKISGPLDYYALNPTIDN